MRVLLKMRGVFMKKIVGNFEVIVSSTAFVIMVGVVIINVFSRFFLGRSFSFTEEVAFIGFTYSVFLGVCILYRKHSLIAIDMLVERLPEKLKQIARVLNFALLTVANIYLVYLSTVLTISAWVRPTAALRIPYSFVDFAATLAFSIMSIYSIIFLIKALKGDKDFDQPEETY